MVLPLPKGEGRGEGEETLRKPARLRTGSQPAYSACMTPSKLTRVARMLRKKDTWAEKLLWSWLRDQRFSSYKFRRQHPFSPHILGFFCREAWVDIELDGLQHSTREQQAKDVERDAFLEARGIKVLRFWTPACGARKMPSATRFGGRCRSALRIRCQITARQCRRLALATRGPSRIEPARFVRLTRFLGSRSPSPWPSPSGRGNAAFRFATSRNALDW